MTTPHLTSRRERVPADFAAMQDYFWEQGWTDGLPVVPPTGGRRARHAGIGGRRPATLAGRDAAQQLAGHAGEAGHQRRHGRVQAGAFPRRCDGGQKAAMRDGFNLAGTAATTGGCNQVVIVNGPVAPKVGIQADAGCFGPGFRANAAIGRALRLIVRNVAGLTPGEMDKATLSSPGRYSFCFAENEARSPWEPLHVEKGYAPKTARSPWPASSVSTA